MRHGARIDVGEDKADPLDFALWKGAKPGEPSWDSPWGPGRPGWHIECSAMSLKYLGTGFDIHGGGRDLIFPHHENEIAQAEGALDEPFVRFWMHNGMLNLREEKMSKSLGNILTLRAHPGRAPAGGADRRLLGQPLPQPAGVQRRAAGGERAAGGSAAERLPGAGRPGRGRRGRQRRTRVRRAPRAPSVRALLDRAAARRQAFADALADDLNTAAALAEVFGLAREVNAALAAGGADRRRRQPHVRAEMVEMVAHPGARRRGRRRGRRSLPTSWPWPKSGSSAGPVATSPAPTRCARPSLSAATRSGMSPVASRSSPPDRSRHAALRGPDRRGRAADEPTVGRRGAVAPDLRPQPRA